MVIAGTALVVSSQVSCYTSAAGNVVAPDPVNPTILSANLSSGTLGAGPYYVRYWNGSGESVVSGEATFTLSSPLRA